MRLVVNGAEMIADVATLSQLLDVLGYGGVIVATAVNGTFVSAARRGAHTLTNDDRVEIVSARQGG